MEAIREDSHAPDRDMHTILMMMKLSLYLAVVCLFAKVISFCKQASSRWSAAVNHICDWWSVKYRGTADSRRRGISQDKHSGELVLWILVLSVKFARSFADKLDYFRLYQYWLVSDMF